MGAVRRALRSSTIAGLVVVSSVLAVEVGADAPSKPAGTELSVDAQVPADTYLIGNVTAINQPPTGGFVSVFGDSFNGTSTVNTRGSDVLPNAFIADPGADGRIGVRIGGQSRRHVIVDSVAELAKNPNTLIFPSPVRVVDTRQSGPAVTAGGTFWVDLGREFAGLFVLINLTVDRNDGPGFQATFPCSEGYQGTSSINVKGDGGAQAILNLVKVDANGRICVRSLRAAVGTVIDLVGVISSEADPFQRQADTRAGGSSLRPGSERRFVVGPPNSVFVGTIVSTNPTGRGWVAAYTEAGGYNGTSTLNSDGVNSVANLVILKTDAAGAIHLRTKPDPGGLGTDIVIDGTTIPELAPHLRPDALRLRDTRADAPSGGSPGVGGFASPQVIDPTLARELVAASVSEHATSGFLLEPPVDAIHRIAIAWLWAKHQAGGVAPPGTADSYRQRAQREQLAINNRDWGWRVTGLTTWMNLWMDEPVRSFDDIRLQFGEFLSWRRTAGRNAINAALAGVVRSEEAWRNAMDDYITWQQSVFTAQQLSDATVYADRVLGSSEQAILAAQTAVLGS